jgi:hypothetical protein
MIRFLILLLFVCTQAFGQQQPSLQFGTDVGFTYTMIESSERVETQVGASLFKNRHQLRLAAIIQTYSSEAVNNPKTWQITGGAINYYYTIPTQSPFFDLRFRWESTLQYYENEWDGTFYDQSQNDYIDYRYESKEFFSGNSVAYGFKLNIIKGLYFSTEIAGGIYFSSIKGEREGTPYPTNVRLDFRGYEDVGFFWKTALQLGYKF